MVYASINDLALLSRYSADGDAGAFAELVRRYSDMVYATARRVTGDPSTAEDVSQDCFMCLAQRSESIHGSLPAWLHRTSLNRSLEVRRSERARRLREAKAAAEPPEAVVKEGDAERLIASVDEALTVLPDDTRSLITEHFLCGRSQTELAAELNVNQSTVQRRIEKGLDQLRRQLGQHGSRETPMALSLPLVLAGLRDVRAPAALRQGLIKIGLSGIGGSGSVAAVAGATGSLASKSVVSKMIITLATIALAAVGLIALVRRNAPTTPGAGERAAVLDTTDQLPPAVRDTVRANTPLESVGEIEKKHDLGRTVFDIDFKVGDRGYELRVAEDGTLIWKKPS